MTKTTKMSSSSTTFTKTLLKILIVCASFSSIYFSGRYSIGLHCSMMNDKDYYNDNNNHYRHSQCSQLQRKSKKFDNKKQKPISEIYILSLSESKANIFRHRNLDLDTAAGTTDDDDDSEDDDDNNNDKDANIGQKEDGNNEKDDEEDDDDGTTMKTTTTKIEWFPSYDGMNQSTLKLWSKLTGLGELNSTNFVTMNVQERKDAYASPHVVGCYLSHWRVLEKAWKEWSSTTNGSRSRQKSKRKKKRKRPDLLFVFEDDAICVSNLIERTWDVVKTLPNDWDILYVGGKPVSYHTMNKSLADYLTMETPTVEAGTWKDDSLRPNDTELLSNMCSGLYGTSLSGPFPVYHNNQNSIIPSYYVAKSVLNTHAYVINPKRIRRILRLLSKPMYEYKPIDVIFADDMFREFLDPKGMIKNYNNTTMTTSTTSSAPIKAYLTPYMYCDQDAKRVIINRDDPILPHWEGYYWLPWRLYKGFPDGTSYVWGTMGSSKRRTKTKNDANGKSGGATATTASSSSMISDSVICNN